MKKLIFYTITMICLLATAAMAQPVDLGTTNLTVGLASSASASTPDNTNCLIIEPTEVTVDGTNNVTMDVGMSVDMTDITEEDLVDAKVRIDDSCADYIVVNSTDINSNTLEMTANITVAANAPESTCSISVTSPTVNCSASFTIKQSAEPVGECSIVKITPGVVNIGFGILPRFALVTITFSDNTELPPIDIEDIEVEVVKGVYVLEAVAMGNQLEVLMKFWGVTPGTYNINIDNCGSIPIQIKRGFR